MQTLSRCCTHFWYPQSIRARSKPSWMDQGWHFDSGGLLTAHKSIRPVPSRPSPPGACRSPHPFSRPLALLLCPAAQWQSQILDQSSGPAGYSTFPTGSACRRKGAVSKPGAVVLPTQGGQGGRHPRRSDAAVLPAGWPTSTAAWRRQAPFWKGFACLF